MSSTEEFAVRFRSISRDAFHTSKQHGFWDHENGVQQSPFDITVALSKVALMMSELGECVEALRKPDKFNEADVAEELADTVIRIMDFTYARGIDLGEAIITKMEKNKARPYKHGKIA